MKPWKIIQKLETDNSRLFKESVLSEQFDVAPRSNDFACGLKLALDPLITFGVKKIPKSKKGGPGLAYGPFENLAMALKDRHATGNTAKEEIEFYMNVATMEQWNDWYRRILIKDLK